MAWPTVVPILDEDDICQGVLVDTKGRHCPAGWVIATFDPKVVIRHHWSVGKLSKTCLDVLRMVETELNATTTVDRVNFAMLGIALAADSMPKKKAAQAFNRVMRKLGYTVPCNRTTGNTDA